MIFEKLDEIESLSLKDREKLIRRDTTVLPSKASVGRSNMMLNPLKLKHLNRLDTLSCDSVTLNLEDAIAPSRKKEALINIALFLSHFQKRDIFVVVRVNPLYSGGIEEIEYLKGIGYDAIRLPKVKTKDEILKALDIVPRDREIHISLETKEAFRDLSYWGDIDSRFTTANLGILDLLSDLKLPQQLLKISNPTIEYILTKFLIDSKTASLTPVSFMYQDYKNTQEFKRWCEIEREIGFSSKACMGPAQVEIANEIFSPKIEDIKKAKEIKRLFEDMSAKGINGFMSEEYGFIDEPIYRDALNTLIQLEVSNDK